MPPSEASNLVVDLCEARPSLLQLHLADQIHSKIYSKPHAKYMSRQRERKTMRSEVSVNGLGIKPSEDAAPAAGPNFYPRCNIRQCHRRSRKSVISMTHVIACLTR
jgi:hypothetical protein